MRFTPLLKPGLFVYECIRIIILIVILFQYGRDSGLLIRAIFTTPSILFPIMALFIWLDTDRYQVYLPLFIAGKSIGVFLELGWSIISRQVTILTGAGGITSLAQLTLSGDLFALAIALFIIKDIQKPTQTPEEI